jgi:serine/threonine protein kinase
VASSETDLIGQTIDTKYRVEALLGRGGMGAVFRAVHLGTDRVVALKVIAPSLAEQPEYLARFSREARACGRLRHPGIVDVTDFGIATHNGRSLAYLVMEFLDGATLADTLKAEPRPPLPWVIDILEQTCSAVEEAHRQGILHRDLKPENIWLEPNRRGGHSVKVLDFGLAKLGKDEKDEKDSRIKGLAALGGSVAVDAAQTLASVDAGATLDHATLDHATLDRTIDSGTQNSAASTVSGTPAFMAPEQTRGELVSARSDVYSLGVMAYRMVAGQLPFEGSVTEVLNAQISKEPPPLGSLRPDVHEDAARLIAAALAKDPARRPASAGTFGNMLGAQLEPAGAFFRRAAVLLIDRLGLFLKVGAIACAPLLVASTGLALWQIGRSRLGWPALGGTVSGIAYTLLFVLSLVAQTAIGVMPIFVLRAVAEPLRPLEPREVWRAYAPRIKRWARAMMPFILAIAALVFSLIAMGTVVRWFGPWVRTFPRPVRFAIVLPFVLAPFVAAYLALRRSGIGFRHLGLLGAAMLVEDLPFRAAAKRSDLLIQEAGGLRNAVQRWFTITIGVLSGLMGAYIGSKGGRNAAESLLVMTPFLSIFFMLLLIVNAIVGSLIYLSARRSSGESMDQILESFERH